ncbi:MAG: DUF4332 domain-containing protein [Saprospiraceae bacterium]
MGNIQQHIDRIKEANKITNRKTIYAAGAGLIPFPIVDTAALLGVQLTMLQSIANLYEVEFKEHIAQSLIGSLISSISSIGVIKLIPGLGTLAGGATAAITGATATYALGRVFTQHFDQGGTLLDFDPVSSREYYHKEFENGQLFIAKQDLITQNGANNHVMDKNTEAEKKQVIAENKQLQIMLLSLQKEIESIQAQRAPKSAKNIPNPSGKAKLIAENEQLQVDLFNLQKDIELLKTEKNNKAKKGKEKIARTSKKSLATISKVADLTIIEGIGPKIAEVLKVAGIYSMENLSKTKASRLQQILKDAGGKYNFADPTSWPKQAALAAAGKMEELKAWQDELLGGRTKKRK